MRLQLPELPAALRTDRGAQAEGKIEELLFGESDYFCNKVFIFLEEGHTSVVVHETDNLDHNREVARLKELRIPHRGKRSEAFPGPGPQQTPNPNP